uniref:Endosomal/lysosomal proton channel TMEM175 n=1 Tax=Nomascus leucogenys TaxID=61853 RepID=A0A2I3H4V9_NOMLE
MTFLIVTVAWAAHTRLFQVVGKTDDTLALLNLVSIFLPFSGDCPSQQLPALAAPRLSPAPTPHPLPLALCVLFWRTEVCLGLLEYHCPPRPNVEGQHCSRLSGWCRQKAAALTRVVPSLPGAADEDNVPDPKDVKERFGGSLVAALSATGPRFLAYFGSFATVGLLWFAHHSLFLHVRKATRAMGLLNTLSLAFVGGLPLAYQQTSAFARQPRDELERVRVSCTIIFLASIFQLAIWTTALLHQAETLQPSVWFGGREHVLMFAKLALYPCASLLAFASTCLLSRFSVGIFHLMQIAVPCAFLLLRLLVGLALASLRVLRGLTRPEHPPPPATGQDDPQSQLLPAPC